MGIKAGRRHVGTLMKRMGITAVYRKPGTSTKRCGRGKLDTPFSRASATRKTLPPCFLFPIHAFIAASSLSRPFFAHNPMNDKNTHVRQIRVLR